MKKLFGNVMAGIGLVVVISWVIMNIPLFTSVGKGVMVAVKNKTESVLLAEPDKRNPHIEQYAYVTTLLLFNEGHEWSATAEMREAVDELIGDDTFYKFLVKKPGLKLEE